MSSQPQMTVNLYKSVGCYATPKSEVLEYLMYRCGNSSPRICVETTMPILVHFRTSRFRLKNEHRRFFQYVMDRVRLYPTAKLAKFIEIAKLPFSNITDKMEVGIDSRLYIRDKPNLFLSDMAGKKKVHAKRHRLFSFPECLIASVQPSAMAVILSKRIAQYLKSTFMRR